MTGSPCSTQEITHSKGCGKLFNIITLNFVTHFKYTYTSSFPLHVLVTLKLQHMIK